MYAVIIIDGEKIAIRSQLSSVEFFDAIPVDLLGLLFEGNPFAAVVIKTIDPSLRFSRDPAVIAAIERESELANN